VQAHQYTVLQVHALISPSQRGRKPSIRATQATGPAATIKATCAVLLVQYSTRLHSGQASNQEHLARRLAESYSFQSYRGRGPRGPPRGGAEVRGRTRTSRGILQMQRVKKRRVQISLLNKLEELSGCRCRPLPLLQQHARRERERNTSFPTQGNKSIPRHVGGVRLEKRTDKVGIEKSSKL
jgi:hypothetical protein